MKIYNEKDLPHLNISQNGRCSFANMMRTFKLVPKKVMYRDKKGTNYKHMTNLITDKMLDKLEEKTRKSKTTPWYIKMRLHSIHRIRCQLHGELDTGRQSFRVESLKVSDNPDHFAIMRSLQNKLFRYIRFIGGKKGLAAGELLYRKQTFLDIDEFLSYELDFINRYKFSLYLCQFTTTGAENMTMKITKTEEKTKLHIKSYRSIRKLLKAIRKDQQWKDVQPVKN